ncbi:MAG: HEAT repeat domain-containing protein [Bryobacteraceae bacterium]
MMTLSRILPIVLAAALAAACGKKPPPETARFKVPEGFAVEVVAPASQTGSLIGITFDSLGRPVVSKERGHPTILFDRNGDGVYEAEKVFSTRIRHTHGMWFDGRVLYATANDENKQAGLYRLEDKDEDDVADTFEKVNDFKMSMGEHGPHDIRRGPDGLPTIMLGNHTGVPDALIEPGSPLANYNEGQLLDRYMDARGHAANIWAPGGVVARLNPASGRYTLVVGGFRNAFNHAYDAEGEMFTFDSDMEWDINLPWYRAIRTLHLVPGGDYGWRTGSGKLPAYDMDTLPPLEDQGRGSPVGIEFYQHTAYPREYRGALLEADWSRGRILLVNLVRDGGTYRPGRKTFDFVYGEPLNVTDIEVGPDGLVYFTLGGRDTEGGLYRIRYTRGFFASLFGGERKPEGLLAAVRQPQPFSSWGHAALLKMKEAMGDKWGTDLAALAQDSKAAVDDRVQALLLLQRLGPKPRADLLRPLLADPHAQVRAAATLVVGMHGSDRAKALAASALKDADPFVRRRAAEAVVRMGLSPEQPSFVNLDDVYALLGNPDRFVRYSGRLALERIARDSWKDGVLAETRPIAAGEGLYALARTARSDGDIEPVLSRAATLLATPGISADDTLRLLRVWQLGSIRMKNGAAPAARKQMHDLLMARFPAGDEPLNREFARTLAYCGQPEAIAKILGAMPTGEENQPLQIHYVCCLRAMKQGWTPEQKTALANWFAKAVEWRGGASFTGYLNLMFDSALESYDAGEKKMAYTRVPAFAPLEESAQTSKTKGGLVLPRVLARQKGSKTVSAQEIFEFQMYDPMTQRGEAEKGKEIFEKECASCHRFSNAGKDFGPDLTTVTRRFKKKDILEAVLWPSKTISDQYGSIIVETKEGDVINALLVREDAQKLVLKTAEVERPIEVPKAKVRDRRPSKISIMPEGMLDGYSLDQISHLFAFLLGGQEKTGP